MMFYIFAKLNMSCLLTRYQRFSNVSKHSRSNFQPQAQEEFAKGINKGVGVA
jgi:hypothetical protein